MELSRSYHSKTLMLSTVLHGELMRPGGSVQGCINLSLARQKTQPSHGTAAAPKTHPSPCPNRHTAGSNTGAEKMGSPLLAAGFFWLRFLPGRLLLQLGRQLVLGFADLIQQLVELLRRY